MDNTNLLPLMSEMVIALQSENSSIHKQEVLSEFQECLPILEIIYNPFNHFHLTGDSVEKRADIMEGMSDIWDDEDLSIIDLLHLLIEDNEYSGHKALDLCISFINENMEYSDIILKILNKNLKCGVGVKTINSVYGKVIPEFNVPKAQTYKERLCDFENEEWYISRKLNGLRCLMFIYEDDIKFFTINGNEIYTLDKIKKEMLWKYRGVKNIIVDGEICIIDGKGNENFKAIHKEYNKKDHTIENPKLCAFDIFTIEDFLYKKQSRFDYTYVYDNLKNMFDKFHYIEVLEQTPIVSINHFKYFCDNLSLTWEGYILRKNSPSLFKRSRNLLKVKLKWVEAEYIVLGIKVGTKVMGENEDRQEFTCCGSLEIKHKGETVYVGSGLSDQQRIDYYNNPELIIEKEITVRYFEEIYDKYGKISLQFPSLKAVWSVNGKE